MLDGPPAWASGWGEDEIFGPFAEIQVDRVIQRLRWIPGGSFQMGSPDDESDADERPRHTVTISRGFWMFDTPVTQEMYEVVMGNNPSRFPSDRRPVEQVSWNDTQEFLRKLNERIPALNTGLPTEAEWEYACRAGTTSALYSGDIEILGANNAPELNPIAWYGGNCGVNFDLSDGVDTNSWPEKQYEFETGGTRQVGLKRPNPWGLYDMLGNVYEWCDDGRREYRAEAEIDPTGPPDASADRVIRGGSWRSRARLVRAAYRLWDSPDDRGATWAFAAEFASSSQTRGRRVRGVQSGRSQGGAGRRRAATIRRRAKKQVHSRWFSLFPVTQ